MQQVANVVSSQIAPLTDVALRLVEARFGDFRDLIDKRFADQEKASVKAFANPDFQFVLSAAAKAYARSGDMAVGNALVDMLARRSLLESRSREQLVINRALEVVPELTTDEIAAVTSVFAFRHLQALSVRNRVTFAEFVRPIIHEFGKSLVRNQSCVDYLCAAGCGSMGMMSLKFCDCIRNSYGGLFSTGTTREEIAAVLPVSERSRYINLPLMPSFIEPGKLQIAAVNERAARSLLDTLGLSNESRNKLIAQFIQSYGGDEVVLGAMETLVQGVRHVKDVWDNFGLLKLDLSPAGIAIGQASYVRVTGAVMPLSIWVT